jgi:hypothetical protein
LKGEVWFRGCACATLFCENDSAIALISFAKAGRCCATFDLNGRFLGPDLSRRGLNAMFFAFFDLDEFVAAAHPARVACCCHGTRVRVRPCVPHRSRQLKDDQIDSDRQLRTHLGFGAWDSRGFVPVAVS